MTPNDVKTVADNIDDFIEVPDGVERLRKAVLTLAVSGRLVPQDLSEGTADELYATIQKERTQIAKTATGRKKAVKPLAPITPEKVPFEIPTTWKWVQLNDIVKKISGGGTPSKNNSSYWGGDIPWASIKDMNVELYLEHTKDTITKAGLLSKPSLFKPAGSIIVGTRMGLGKIAILGKDMAINQDLKALKLFDQIDCNYFVLHYRTLTISGKGVTVDGIKQEELLAIPFSLPPLAEQKRIVKKVEEVMRQLDELEAKKRERDEVRTRLARSAMLSLGKGESKIAFENLSELIRTPADLEELEGALLTLAVSGKLVQQDKKDGTAESLLKQIQLKRTKIKKGVEIEEKDKLFPIPSNWVWARLEDTFDVRDGTHDSPKYHSDGYPLVTSKNLYHGSLDFLNVKYISEADHKKISERSKVDRDDILFAMIGSIGNPVVVDTDTEFSIKNVALFKYYDRTLSEPMFLLTYLKYAAQNMRATSAGGVQSFVSLGFLRQYPIPIPPLAEQKRIVKKVEEMMDLTKQLREVLK